MGRWRTRFDQEWKYAIQADYSWGGEEDEDYWVTNIPCTELPFENPENCISEETEELLGMIIQLQKEDIIDKEVEYDDIYEKYKQIK